jgi:RHS repeat-associated protein
MSTVELANGTWEEIGYDVRNRPTSINLKKPGPVNLRAQSYTYDDASNVLSHTVEGIATTYEYDNINQLTREYKGTSGAPTWQIGYDYDANGNRWHRNVLGGVQETYNNDVGDKLTSVSWAGGSKSFTYDGAGRRKTENSGGPTTTYNWDFESRITSITKPGMTTNTMAYNGLDTRVSKVDSGGTRSFKRDGAYVTDPVLSDTAGGTTTKYTPGVSERRGSTSRYLHSGIKNADSRTTTGTTVEATRSYDAFGNVISLTGTWQGFFGYAGGFGYQEEPDTGLKLLGHRYYDSTTGRFLSRDEGYEGRNWYTYCANNPITNADPTGLWKAVIVVGAMPWYEGIAVAIAIRVWTEWLKQLGATEIIVITPTEGQLIDVLSDESVEGFVLIGHGATSVSDFGGVTLKSGQFDSDTIRRIAVRRKKRMKYAHIYACCSSPLSEALLMIAETSLTWSTGVGYSDLFKQPDTMLAGPNPMSDSDKSKWKAALSKNPPKRFGSPKRKKGGKGGLFRAATP